MPVSLRRYTVADLRTFPDDGNRYELIDGVLFVTPAPMPPHEVIVQRLAMRLGVHLARFEDVHVATRSEVVRAPGNCLEPDIQVYRADAVPDGWAGVTERWLAVEVASRSSRLYDRAYKRDGYLALGVREVWLVDPIERVVRVTRRGEPDDRLETETVEWEPPAPVPPLRFSLEPVWRGLPGW